MSNARERAMNALARMLAKTPETPAEEEEMLGEVVDAFTEHVEAKLAESARMLPPSSPRIMPPRRSVGVRERQG